MFYEVGLCLVIFHNTLVTLAMDKKSVRKESPSNIGPNSVQYRNDTYDPFNTTRYLHTFMLLLLLLYVFIYIIDLNIVVIVIIVWCLCL